jgi:hypothetical protein
MLFTAMAPYLSLLNKFIFLIQVQVQWVMLQGKTSSWGPICVNPCHFLGSGWQRVRNIFCVRRNLFSSPTNNDVMEYFSLIHFGRIWLSLSLDELLGHHRPYLLTLRTLSHLPQHLNWKTLLDGQQEIIITKQPLQLDIKRLCPRKRIPLHPLPATSEKIKALQHQFYPNTSSYTKQTKGHK